MENLEEFYDGGVEDSDVLEVYDEVVSGLAGSIYLELEKLVSAHGQGSITGLMPLLVSVLESLEGTCAQLRERDAELDLLREDRERLLAQYEREKSTRKHAEERYMELEDWVDQERKAFKVRLESVESQTRQMELKARNYADQIASMEEQKTALSKENNSLAQAYNKIARNYKDLMYQRALSLEAGRHSAVSTPTSTREKKITPADFQEGPRSLDCESVTYQGDPVSCGTEKTESLEDPTPSLTSLDADPLVSDPCPLKSNPASINNTTLEDEASILESEQPVTGNKVVDKELQSQFDDIVNSIPELAEDAGHREASTPSRADEQEEEFAGRNTDSLYAELSDIGPEFVEDVDEGADLQGVGNHLETILSENAQLQDTLNLVDTARKHLIARVDELMRDREALQLEGDNLKEMLSRHKVKVKELEEDLRRAYQEVEEVRKASTEDTEVDTPAAQRKRFTRTEMARVVMERNQYKERLMELQDAVRRTELLRVSKDVQAARMNKSPFWLKFSRLFSSAPGKNNAPVPAPIMHYLPGYYSTAGADPTGTGGLVQLRSNRARTISTPDRQRGVKSTWEQKRDHYRHIRTHIWKEHGRLQMHGWSQPPGISKEEEDGVRTTETGMKTVPALVQLRILDQKDPATKLWCATALCSPYSRTDLGLSQVERSSVGSDHSSGTSTVDSSSLVWICSGTHSVSEVMIIDAKRSNLVLDQFVICNSHVLCFASVPGFQKYSPSQSEEDLFSPQEEQTDTPSSLSSSLTSRESVGSDGSAFWERCSTDSKCQDSDRLQAEDSNSQSELSVEMNHREATTPAQRKSTTESEGESTTLPTVWIGTQEGSLYIHSSVTEWRKCLQKVHLKDSIHSLIHAKGLVVAALANGTLAIFNRDADGQWDLTNHRLLDLGRPHHSIRCVIAVGNKLWCGCQNRVYIISPKTCRIEKWFEATPRRESQVRHMAVAGKGVWVSVRLDSTLRLFHAQTGQPLQDVDISSFVDKMLGCAQLGLSYVQVSALSIFCKRLWIGTASGTILSIPFTDDIHGHSTAVASPKEGSPKSDSSSPSIPYCSMEYAQVCFHGHRDAVRFFVSVPGCINPTLAGISSDSEEHKGNYPTTLVMSGGEGYINYRIGDDNGDHENSFGDLLQISPVMRRAERSHLIVWQVKTCRN